MNQNTHGELALLAAIEAGMPVATNPAQAAELVARENKSAAVTGRIAADLVRCKECRKIGERAFWTECDPHVALPICVACKRKADELAARRLAGEFRNGCADECGDCEYCVPLEPTRRELRREWEEDRREEARKEGGF